MLVFTTLFLPASCTFRVLRTSGHSCRDEVDRDVTRVISLEAAIGV